MEGREEGKQEEKRKGKQSKAHCRPPHGPHSASPGETQCEEDTTSPACHQRTFFKHSEGKAVQWCSHYVDQQWKLMLQRERRVQWCSHSAEQRWKLMLQRERQRQWCSHFVDQQWKLRLQREMWAHHCLWCSHSVEQHWKPMLRKWGRIQRGGYEPMNASERLLRGSHSPAR